MSQEDLGDVRGVAFGRHVSREEANAATDPAVGAGTPDTAPVDLPPESDWLGPSWRPTRKLLAAIATAVLAYAAVKVADLDPDLAHLLNVVAPLVAAYLTENDPTPGGVPDAR